ncbi:MAG TPA: META domain-containing protein [Steroidobacteraceae bacterium]|nr:META domain-containing protein [Steroidobacteraceae bacterium]
MDARLLAIGLVSLFAIAACEKKAEPPKPDPAAATSIAHQAAKAEPSFINRVWAVTDSTAVAPGSLRVFLSDGTLVMTSVNEKPALGAWHYEDGHLIVTEEGRNYLTDILELTDRSFRIRMQSPGEPVEIAFAPAEQASPAAAVSAKQAARAMQVAAAPAAPPLWGTAWRLEDLAGAKVLGGAPATLEFSSEGRASGSGSCNGFNGVVTLESGTIQFGGLAATRKACPEAVMRQEETYFAALRDAERYEVDGDSLRIFSANQPAPLRFAAMAATSPKPGAQIERAASSTLSSLNGVWTIVGYHIPGVSAMTEDQARARVGESVRLTDRSAVSSGSACREPRYATRQVATEGYLADEFRLSQSSVPPLASRNQLRVMDVSCGGSRWSSLGSTLLQLDRDHALAPWDGVFFALERDHDWRGVGQEPGWQLEIRQGDEMRFTYDYGKGTAVTPAGRGDLDARTGTRTFRAAAGSDDLRVEIVPVACSDSMSGRAFPATVTVTLNGHTFRGCGEALATPFQG